MSKNIAFLLCISAYVAAIPVIVSHGIRSERREQKEQIRVLEARFTIEEQLHLQAVRDLAEAKQQFAQAWAEQGQKPEPLVLLK